MITFALLLGTTTTSVISVLSIYATGGKVVARGADPETKRPTLEIAAAAVYGCTAVVQFVAALLLNAKG